MTNPNFARNLFVASGAAIACLGLTACTGSAAAESTASLPATALPSPSVNTSSEQPTVRTTYYPNGTRITIIDEPSGYPVSLLGYCEAGSLVEVYLEDYHGYGGAGGGIVRTPPTEAFHPCDNGRLDPTDFETPKK